MRTNGKRKYTAERLSKSRKKSFRLIRDKKSWSLQEAGSFTRISLLETRIQNLIEVGDREALKKALREYVEAWLRLEEGGSFERLP